MHCIYFSHEIYIVELQTQDKVMNNYNVVSEYSHNVDTKPRHDISLKSYGSVQYA